MQVPWARIVKLAQIVLRLLNSLDKDGEHVPEAKKAFSSLLAQVSTVFNNPELSDYDLIVAPNQNKDSLRLRNILGKYGVSLVNKTVTKTGKRVFLLQVDPTLVTVLTGNMRLEMFPALIRYAQGVPIDTFLGTRNILRYLSDEEVVKGLPDKFMSKNVHTPVLNTAKPKVKKNTVTCALLTDTGATFKRVCCGGRVRDMPLMVCAYRERTVHRNCLKCQQRIALGDDVPPELLERIAAKKASALEKLDQEVAVSKQDAYTDGGT